MSTLKNSWFKYLYLKDRKILISLIVLMILLSSILGYLTPIAMANLYEAIEKNKDFYYHLYFLTGILASEYFAYVIYQASIGKYVQHLLMSLRGNSFTNWIMAKEQINEDSDSKYNYPLGEILARVLSDTESVVELVSSGSFKIFIDFSYILSCLISFINLNTTSGIVLIITEVLACILLILGSRKMASIYLAVRKANGSMSRMLANVSGGLAFTFFTPNGGYASKRSIKSFDDFLKKQLTANIWDASYFSIAESLFPILLAILVFVFPYSNITEVAVIAAIIDLIQRSISPIKQIASKISGIQRAKAGFARITEFNDDLEKLEKSGDETFKSIGFKSLNVDIEKFTYPNSDKSFSLENIHLNFKGGELVGIVGMSGSGKSTLLKILANQIIAKSIHIQFDAKDGKLILDKETSEKYQSQVSIISQDSHVFSNTLSFNISLDENEDERKILKFWDKVISEIPYLKKWGIKITDQINPKELSLGQKQLLSALRSCYLVRPIVLFDEISSGLDSELEEALRKLVLLIQEHSLTIIVAHRVETIVKANQIIVMENGKIQGIGKHHYLLDNSQTYQDFIRQLNKV